MALIKTFTLPSGQIFLDAYARVETVAGNKRVCRAVVNVYASKALAEESRWPIEALQQIVEFELDVAKPSWEQAYEAVVAHPAFIGAVPG